MQDGSPSILGCPRSGSSTNSPHESLKHTVNFILISSPLSEICRDQKEERNVQEAKIPHFTRSTKHNIQGKIDCRDNLAMPLDGIGQMAPSAPGSPYDQSHRKRIEGRGNHQSIHFLRSKPIFWMVYEERDLIHQMHFDSATGIIVKARPDQSIDCDAACHEE